LPHITIPYFNIEKFPVGISLIGRPWSDAEIISYAAALEIK
jgi:Asp-tRNA(Asn)/Glu-tRNA(Gln) amidotransferase A subunit family amidase